MQRVLGFMISQNTLVENSLLLIRKKEFKAFILILIQNIRLRLNKKSFIDFQWTNIMNNTKLSMKRFVITMT